METRPCLENISCTAWQENARATTSQSYATLNFFCGYNELINTNLSKSSLRLSADILFLETVLTSYHGMKVSNAMSFDECPNYSINISGKVRRLWRNIVKEYYLS